LLLLLRLILAQKEHLKTNTSKATTDSVWHAHGASSYLLFALHDIHTGLQGPAGTVRQPDETLRTPASAARSAGWQQAVSPKPSTNLQHPPAQQPAWHC
jgi:hypothetical protein